MKNYKSKTEFLPISAKYCTTFSPLTLLRKTLKTYQNNDDKFVNHFPPTRTLIIFINFVFCYITATARRRPAVALLHITIHAIFHMHHLAYKYMFFFSVKMGMFFFYVCIRYTAPIYMFVYSSAVIGFLIYFDKFVDSRSKIK